MGFVLSLTIAYCQVITMTELQSPLDKQMLEAQVRQAFDAVRKSDLSQVSELEKSGVAVVALLGPYLDDANEAVRREAVALLATIGGEGSLELLAKALADRSTDVRERAAAALYERYDVATLTENAAVGRAVVASLALDNPPAAVILLASYFPSDDTERGLVALRDRKPGTQVKLFAWSAPVATSLVAKLSLAHLGSPEAQANLVQAAAKATPAEAEFFLAALREADSSRVLLALSRFLDDTREAATLVSSAPEIRRRICDLAVDAFVERLDLDHSFERSKLARYDAGQIAEVRKRVAEAVPDRPVPGT